MKGLQTLMQNPTRFEYDIHKSANGFQVLGITKCGTEEKFTLPYVIKAKDLPETWKNLNHDLMVQEPGYRSTHNCHIVRTGQNYMTADGEYIRWSDFKDPNLKPKAFEDNTLRGVPEPQELIEYMFDKLDPELLKPLDDFLANL